MTTLDPAEKTARDIGVIAHVREDWASDFNAKRIDDIIRLYDADAVFLRPNAQRTSGRDAIRALFTSVLATNTPHIVFHGITIEGSDNLAYDSGTYEETISTASGARNTRGDYLLILKRNAEGRWLIVLQSWTDVTSSEK